MFVNLDALVNSDDLMGMQPDDFCSLVSPDTSIRVRCSNKSFIGIDLIDSVRVKQVRHVYPLGDSF